MQVTIDTRHDTLQEALAVIQLAFAQKNDLGAPTDTPEPLRQARGRKANRSTGGRGSSRAGNGQNKAALDEAPSEVAIDQGSGEAGDSAAATEEPALGRPRASARKAPTKKSSASGSGARKKGSTKKAPTKSAAGKAAPAARKRTPAKGPAASRATVTSNTGTNGQADVIRAWARAQGMQVKAAGRMPAAVVTAYNDAHS